MDYTQEEAYDARLSVLALVRAYCNDDTEGISAILADADIRRLRAITESCTASLADLAARYTIALAALEDEDALAIVTTAPYRDIVAAPGVRARVEHHIRELQAKHRADG